MKVSLSFTALFLTFLSCKSTFPPPFDCTHFFFLGLGGLHPPFPQPRPTQCKFLPLPTHTGFPPRKPFFPFFWLEGFFIPLPFFLGKELFGFPSPFLGPSLPVGRLIFSFPFPSLEDGFSLSLCFFPLPPFLSDYWVFSPFIRILGSFFLGCCKSSGARCCFYLHHE